MSPERWMLLEELFHTALSIPPAERAKWLEFRCAGDEALRRQVEELLAADNEGNNPLDESARKAAQVRMGRYLEQRAG